MTYLPKDELKPDKGRKGPSRNRIVLWVIAAGGGLYMLITGLVGILG